MGHISIQVKDKKDLEIDVEIEGLFLKPEVVFHEVVNRFKEIMEEK